MKKIFYALVLCVALRAGGAMADPGAHRGSQETGGANGATTPNFSLTRESLIFGNQTVGTTSSPQVATLTNSGSTTLGNIKITIVGDFAETNNCGTSLRPGAKCSINVTFTPAIIGVLSGTLTILDNARGGTQVIS